MAELGEDSRGRSQGGSCPGHPFFRKLLALWHGIVLGALLYSEWNILAGISLVFEIAAGGLIIAEGGVAEEIYLLASVVMLGVLTSFIYMSCGLQAFSERAITKARTRIQAQFVSIISGIIFFDDAFSNLVGGNVSRSITDQPRIPRAKLLCLVDVRRAISLRQTSKPGSKSVAYPAVRQLLSK